MIVLKHGVSEHASRLATLSSSKLLGEGKLTRRSLTWCCEEELQRQRSDPAQPNVCEEQEGRSGTCPCL